MSELHVSCQQCQWLSQEYRGPHEFWCCDFDSKYTPYRISDGKIIHQWCQKKHWEPDNLFEEEENG